MLENLSEKEFNEIFKQVSEAKEFEYNPDAWADVEKRLLQKKRRRFFFFWFWGLGVLLLIGGGLWLNTLANTDKNNSKPLNSFYEHEPSNTSQHNTNPNASNPPKTSSTKSASSNPPSPLIESAQQIPQKKIAKQGDSAATPSSFTSVQSVNEKRSKEHSDRKNKNQIQERDYSTSSDNSTRELTESIQPIKSGHDDHKLHDNNPSGKDSQKTNSLSVTDTTDKYEKDTHAIADNQILIDIPFSISTIQFAPLKIPFDPLVLSFDNIVIIEESPKQSPFLAIELIAGRERSTSNTSYFRSPDTKLGLNLNYTITNKLSATVGLGYREDYYGAGAGAYKPLKGFWTDGIAPTYTKANCKILDIPLGLNYHFSGIAENGLFVSAGLTSIFMIEEHYRFSYPEDSKEHVTYWGGQNENKHLFNDVYLSAGYQKRLSRHLSLKLTPYLQIPIKGIGHGNLKLYTLGTKFSIQFMSYRNR